MRIDDLLKNLDEHTIQKNFLSDTVLKTLYKYDEKLLMPSILRKLVSEQIPHEEMLRDKKMRYALIKSLTKKDSRLLANLLNLKKTNELLNLKFQKNSNQERKLFQFFETEYIEMTLSNLPSKQSIIELSMPLFDDQRNAINKLQQYLEGDDHAALLHMPTGAGKTRTSMRVISNIFLTKKPVWVIWLALTEELCEQAIEEFEETWKAVGDRQMFIHRLFGQYSSDILSEINDGNEGFIVAGISKLNHIKNEQFLTTLADHVELVVMDEAHHAIAPTYKRIIEILAKKHKSTKLLGLSATPGRKLEEDEENLQLSQFFNNHKVGLSENENPVERLIKQGRIAEPNIRIIKHNDELTDDDVRLIANNLEISPKILEKLGKDIRRNIKIISLVEELVEQGEKRIIVFAPTIRSSRDISLTLSTKNFTSYYIDSNVSDQCRREIIQKYTSNSNHPIILCNVNILTAGFDAPKTSAVVIARPTKSLVLYSQMLGRAMRGKQVGGNEKCFIRVISDSKITAFEDIVKAFEYWDEQWN